MAMVRPLTAGDSERVSIVLSSTAGTWQRFRTCCEWSLWWHALAQWRVDEAGGFQEISKHELSSHQREWQRARGYQR